MFRRWPFFQRLLSWTKPFAPEQRGTRYYERYEWNSLTGEEDRLRAIQPGLMDGTSYFPSRAEMEQSLTTFAADAGVTVRYGTRWTGTMRDGDRFTLETTDGPYRCRVPVFAFGIAEPWKPDIPGMEAAPHYADTRAPETYAGKRILIIGKEVSAFELANGFLPWAKQIVLASPRPVALSVVTKSLVGVRARYVQPFEDHVLGGGVGIVNASIDGVDRIPSGFRVRTSRSDGGGPLVFEVDDVIATTGFTPPLGDLAAFGVPAAGRQRSPSPTPLFPNT